MAFVEEPIQCSAAPAKRQAEVPVNGADDPADGTQRHAIDMSELELRNHLLTDARLHSEVTLTPAQPDSNHSNRPTDLSVVHSNSLKSEAHPPIIGGNLSAASEQP